MLLWFRAPSSCRGQGRLGRGGSDGGMALLRPLSAPARCVGSHPFSPHVVQNEGPEPFLDLKLDSCEKWAAGSWWAFAGLSRFLSKVTMVTLEGAANAPGLLPLLPLTPSSPSRSLPCRRVAGPGPGLGVWRALPRGGRAVVLHGRGPWPSFSSEDRCVDRGCAGDHRAEISTAPQRR